MPTRTADVAALYDAERDGTVVLRLHVQPGAARSEVVGPHGEALRVRVAAPAVEGRANAAVVRLLADSLGLRRSDVALVGGSTGRRKRVRLQGVDARRLTRWLEEIAAAPARSSK
jgi:uncharacterized protein (TIGR00251 family)